MEFIKELIRFTLLLLLTPIKIFFYISRSRLVYLDETRLGHFFGDSIPITQFGKYQFRWLILPIVSPCSGFIVSQLKKRKIFIINSLLLKTVTGWFRNDRIIVYNLTNSLNYVHDRNIFTYFTKTPRYKFIDLDPHYLISKDEIIQIRNQFLKKYSINSDKILVFNHRSLKHNSPNQNIHRFRDFEKDTANALISAASQNSWVIINLSDIFVEKSNVLNLKINSDFISDDIIFSLLTATHYVGDSTGTSVIAQLLRINSFLYNIFPKSFEITNRDSEMVPVSYKYNQYSTVTNDFEVNQFNTTNEFIIHRVDLIPKSTSDTLTQFEKWL
jgi:hypothetical protein